MTRSEAATNAQPPALLPPAGVVRAIVQRALDEDIGFGDLTTVATVPEDALASGRILARDAGVIAGLPVAEDVFAALDERVRFDSIIRDGAAVQDGDVVARIEGPARAVLTGERVALNFLQQLSGVATAARGICEQLEGTHARLLDTRKTVPGLRALQRYAVRLGGGTSHRFNLFDGVLIKENHIAMAGGIKAALAGAKATVGPMTRVEIEVETLEQLDEAIAAGADMVLLDNMSPDLMHWAVERADGRVILEASGDISVETARAVAESGVDFLSSGAVTHSSRALNLSLLLDPPSHRRD